VLELTTEGRAALRERRKITLTRPAKTAEAKGRQAGEITCDEALFEQLRQLRKRLADELAVPPYIVFSDVALRQMARDYPANDRDFGRISGVGEKKLREFGAVFLAEIASYLQTHPRQIFAADSFTAPAAPRVSLNDTTHATWQAFHAGQSIPEIAASRRLAPSTIYGHLCTAIESGKPVDLNRFFTAAEQQQIADAFTLVSYGNLTGVREMLGEKFDYNLLRIFRAAKATKQL
jgi:ATP-dependent DNA helicase RecQ